MGRSHGLPRRAERGFTLLEIAVTSAMALIVFASMFGAMLAQQRSYQVQLETSEVSQNARAALAIVKHEVRMAGWGLTSSTVASFPAVGTCNNSTNVYACDELPTFGDAGRTSDRLRLVSIRSGELDRQASWSSGTLSTFSTTTYPPTPPVTVGVPPLLPVGSYVIIDGDCTSPVTQPYAAVAEIVSAAAGSGYHHQYTVTAPPTATGYPTLAGCAAMSTDVRAGRAHIVDFYVDRNEPTPRLMMDINPTGAVDGTGAPIGGQVVAYGVDSLQVEYGLDLGSDLTVSPTDIPDQHVDIWCHDLINCDLTPVTATAFPTAERAARIIAIRIGIVARSESSVLDEGDSGPAFSAFDTTIAGDEYRRWLFRGSVRLRNNEL